MKYRFETTTTMKDYNGKNYWIDGDIIHPVEITADNIRAALDQWRERVQERDYIEISRNAIKRPAPMYVEEAGEAVQIGYVITGKTEIACTTQYIDLWTTIKVVARPDFMGV